MPVPVQSTFQQVTLSKAQFEKFVDGSSEACKKQEEAVDGFQASIDKLNEATTQKTYADVWNDFRGWLRWEDDKHIGHIALDLVGLGAVVDADKLEEAGKKLADATQKLTDATQASKSSNAVLLAQLEKKND